MSEGWTRALAALGLTLLGCAGASGAGSGNMNAHPGRMMGMPAGAEDTFGALEVGADYATSMTRVNREPFLSPTHGRRWVNVYVNAVGLRAYQAGEDLPVGSIVVKESFEDGGGRPDLTRRGPVFVMERRAAGYAPDRGDYWYALHWAQPTGPNARLPNGQALPPLYWRGRSARVQYCENCHSAYEPNRMGGVPREQQTWGAR